MNYFISSKLLSSSISLVKFNLVVGNSKGSMMIAPTLSQYGLNLREFNTYLDKYSFFVSDSFEIHCRFLVSNSDISNFEVLGPSVMFFLKHLHLYETKKLSKLVILKLIYLISLFKNNKVAVSKLSLFTICRNILNTYKSFNLN